MARSRSSGGPGFSGTFDDNVEVGGAKITITPTAKIKGDLIYSAPLVEQQKGSLIMGKMIRKGWKVREKEAEQWWGRGKKVIASIGIFLYILSLPAFLIAGALIHYAFPKKTEAINARSLHLVEEHGHRFCLLVSRTVGIVISPHACWNSTGIYRRPPLCDFPLYQWCLHKGLDRKKFPRFHQEVSKTSFFWPFLVRRFCSLLPSSLCGLVLQAIFLLLSLGSDVDGDLEVRPPRTRSQPRHSGLKVAARN
jgi:hypothetical protein